MNQMQIINPYTIAENVFFGNNWKIFSFEKEVCKSNQTPFYEQRFSESNIY